MILRTILQNNIFIEDMPKIIKIKESELRNLVKQVISEAQNKDPKVIAVQNALKRAGFGKYLGKYSSEIFEIVHFILISLI